MSDTGHIDAMNFEAACALSCANSRANTPFCLLRPRIYIDGDQWCALYGDNLQDGVAGFGKSPAAAEAAFNAAWDSKLETPR